MAALGERMEIQMTTAREKLEEWLNEGGISEESFLEGWNAAIEAAAETADKDASNMAYEGYTYIARRISEGVRALKESI